jgi:hypothetical protein
MDRIAWTAATKFLTTGVVGDLELFILVPCGLAGDPRWSMSTTLPITAALPRWHADQDAAKGAAETLLAEFIAAIGAELPPRDGEGP